MASKAKIKKGNPVARDLRSPKYAMRVVPSSRHYVRAKEKSVWRYA